MEMQARLPKDVILPVLAQLWLVLGPPLLRVVAECVPHAVTPHTRAGVAKVDAPQAIAHADLKRIADMRLAEP